MTTPTRRTKSFTSRGAAGPIELVIDDDAPYYAIPAIPAAEFGPFMAIQTSISVAVAPFSNKETPPTPEEAEAAIAAIVRLSLEGLEKVLDDESLARIKEKVESRTNPIDVTTLSQLFSYLANIYNGGTGEDEEDANDPSTASASESADSSALTGGSSAADSSSGTSLSTTDPGTPAALAPAPESPVEATATETPAPTSETPAPAPEAPAAPQTVTVTAEPPVASVVATGGGNIADGTPST